MKIEIAEHGRMTESGSSLLRLIQNQDIPLLDLLVREAVQNALDAAAHSSGLVNVDISTGEFFSSELNRHFEKIENGLNRQFRPKKYKYISIRDSNTYGLTGPMRYTEVRNNRFGNLLKLVYEICKPQSNEGAGGSWGLGKTIYFRAGIGLVLYYSRIYQNGKYQSRLAACLVEDETKKDALIPYGAGVRRGIAWWGKRDGLVGSNTVPLDNKQEIERILQVFDICPYCDKETGTTVIIPYINEDTLLNEVYAKNETTENKPYWVGNISDYLTVSFQRWYAPRLLNAAYPYGPYLSASVNGEKIKVSTMLPAFRYIRELYILATGGSLDENSLIHGQNVQFHVESIDLRGVLETTSAGKFVYTKLNRSQLQMEPPANQKTPYQQIQNTFVQMENGNGPIIACTRRPGMIVCYDYEGSWTHRMPKTGPGEYVIGLFVANSNNTLKAIIDPKTNKKMTLEEYIRQGERADHASWADRNIGGNSLRIIANIQKHVINKIKKQYIEVVKETYERQNIGLGHALANILLPETGFGSSANPPLPPNRPGPPSRRRSSRKSALHIVGEPEYTSENVRYNFEMQLKGKPCLLALQILTDFRRYEANVWEGSDEIGKAFPLEFQTFSITRIQKVPGSKGSQYDSNLQITDNKNRDSNVDIEVEAGRSDGFSTWSYVTIKPVEGEYYITGSFSFSFRDRGVKGTFDFKELDNE